MLTCILQYKQLLSGFGAADYICNLVHHFQLDEGDGIDDPFRYFADPVKQRWCAYLNPYYFLRSIGVKTFLFGTEIKKKSV